MIIGYSSPTLEAATQGFEINVCQFWVIATVETAPIKTFSSRQVVTLFNVFGIKRLILDVACDHRANLNARSRKLGHILLTQFWRLTYNREGKAREERDM